MKLKLAVKIHNLSKYQDEVYMHQYDTCSLGYRESEDGANTTPQSFAYQLNRFLGRRSVFDNCEMFTFVVNGIIWNPNLPVAAFLRLHPDIDFNRDAVYMVRTIKNEFEQRCFIDMRDSSFSEFSGVNINKFRQKHPDIEINYQNPLFIHHLVMDGYVAMQSLKTSEFELVLRKNEFGGEHRGFQLIKEPSCLSMAVSATGSALYATGSALSSLASWGSSFFVRPSTHQRRSSDAEHLRQNTHATHPSNAV